MNPYAMLGSGAGTNEASALGARLSTWHDAMVAHERRLRLSSADDRCDDECPHAEARTLWSEAIATFGPRANELAFLRARARQTPPRSSSIRTARQAASRDEVERQSGPIDRFARSGGS
jgi:hypothetical protein